MNEQEWMELLVSAEGVPERKLESLLSEANQIVAITVASIRTLRSRRTSRPNPKSKIANPKWDIK